MIILEGPIGKFINKNHNLVKRYLVLNQCGFFIYKDDVVVQSSYQKPLVAIPWAEISKINQREFSAQQMLKRQTSGPL